MIIEAFLIGTFLAMIFLFLFSLKTQKQKFKDIERVMLNNFKELLMQMDKIKSKQKQQVKKNG